MNNIQAVLKAYSTIKNVQEIHNTNVWALFHNTLHFH